MYERPAFAETNPTRIRGLIEANPFGTLVTISPRGLEASHIPFVLHRQGDGFVLAGHLASGNPQCDRLDGSDALAIFTGPHAYVSPGWYGVQPSVPTWDYVAVHVSGALEPLHDVSEIQRDLQAMAEGDPYRFDVEGMDPAYRARMIAGIRAFRLRPAKIQAQWKMSQNRSADDRTRVIAALQTQGDETSLAVAALIAETLPEVAGGLG